MQDNKRNGLSRRDFLAASMIGLSLAGLPDWFVKRALAAENEIRAGYPRKFGANDTIQVAGIGIGGSRGGYRQGLNDTHAAANHPGTKVVAVCDIDQLHLDEGAASIGPDCDKIKDFRDVLARKDIDAVVIGTPDHWHVLVAIAALKAGKDVYCEKPLTLTIDEGKKLVDVWKKTGRIFQVGSQQRSDARFRMACELVRNGRLGKMQTVEANLPTGPTGGPFQKETPWDGFDYEMWLGPRPEVDFFPNRCHGNFRYFLDYSGGMMTDWGAHHNDIAQWGLGKDRSGPTQVEGIITTAPMTDYSTYQKAWIDSRIHSKKVDLPAEHNNMWDTVPAFQVTYTYDNGVQLITSNVGENGVKFTGENGWIFVSRSRIDASDPNLLSEPLPDNSIKLYESNDHMGNFLECMRSGKQPICDVEIGHRSATVCHLGNISMLLGRKLQWNPDKQEFVNDRDANAMLKRPMRKPWTI
jgi:predicted dehydrogenase